MPMVDPLRWTHLSPQNAILLSSPLLPPLIFFKKRGINTKYSLSVRKKREGPFFSLHFLLVCVCVVGFSEQKKRSLSWRNTETESRGSNAHTRSKKTLIQFWLGEFSPSNLWTISSFSKFSFCPCVCASCSSLSLPLTRLSLSLSHSLVCVYVRALSR